MRFVDLSTAGQYALSIGLFFLNLLQIGLLVVLYHHRRFIALFGHLLPTGFAFFLLANLIAVLYGNHGFGEQTPVTVLCAGMALGCGDVVFFGLRARNEERSRMNEGSIKTALDTLPIGIGFFRANGMPMLCNLKMRALGDALCNRNVRSLAEWKQALESPCESVRRAFETEPWTYQMPDGMVWQFTESTIEQGRYVQLLAINLTEDYRLQKELHHKNRELREMIAQVQRMSLRMADLVREQEILNAKMRLHNKMGNCLLAARQYLLHEPSEARRQQVLQLWSKSLLELREEVGESDEADAWDAVVQIAKNLGLEIVTEGALPTEPKTAYMLVRVLRECVTNAIHHADADRLYVSMQTACGKVHAIFKNNGRPPEAEIVEGGGLGSLRKKLAQVGGQMDIQSQPEFALRVTLPEYIEEL